MERCQRHSLRSLEYQICTPIPFDTPVTGMGRIASNFLTQASWRLYMIRQPSTCLCTTSTAPNRHHSRSSLFHGRRRAGLVEQPSALKPQQLKLMQERWSQEEQVSCCLSTLDIWLLLLCNVVLLHFDPSGPPKNQNLPSQIVIHYDGVFCLCVAA